LGHVEYVLTNTSKHMTIYTFTNLHNYTFTLTYVLHSFHLINMTRRTLTFCFKYLLQFLSLGAPSHF
jgi:hypothetical protein